MKEKKKMLQQGIRNYQVAIISFLFGTVVLLLAFSWHPLQAQMEESFVVAIQ